MSVVTTNNAAALPVDLATPIIIFDGNCALCTGGVQWMLKRDPDGVSRFGAVQSPAGEALYRHFGLDPVAFDTFLVVSNGRAYTKWRGVAMAARTMPAPWRQLGFVAACVPSLIGDWLYDIVQRNRIAWFGRNDSCYSPDTNEKRRLM